MISLVQIRVVNIFVSIYSDCDRVRVSVVTLYASDYNRCYNKSHTTVNVLFFHFKPITASVTFDY